MLSFDRASDKKYIPPLIGVGCPWFKREKLIFDGWTPTIQCLIEKWSKNNKIYLDVCSNPVSQ